VGCTAAFLLLGFVGKLADSVPPKIFLPVTFMIRGLLFLAAYTIKDPTKWLFYIVLPLMHVGYYAVVMTFEAYLTKMYPSEVRGMMNSCQGIFSTIGTVFYLNLCNSLNKENSKYPFLGVAGVDAVMVIILILLSSVGLFGQTNEDNMKEIGEEIASNDTQPISTRD
jgi:hypothetical protein